MHLSYVRSEVPKAVWMEFERRYEGNEVVDMPGKVTTLILKILVAVRAGLVESLTWAVKLKPPVAMGVPLITPVAVFNVKPPGNTPVIDQV